MDYNRAFNKVLVLGLVGVVAVLVVNAILSYQNLRQVDEDARWVSRTWQVMTGLENILSLAKDAETGQRGFIITGDPSYLTPYNTAVASIYAQINDLEQLTLDNPPQHARYPEVRTRIAARLAELDKTIELRKSQGIDAARKQVLTGAGKKEMDALRTVIGSMIEHEQGLVRDREGTTAQAYQTAVITGILTAFVALVAVGMFVWLLVGSQRARLEAAAMIARQRQLLQATLAGIGDGVIATDAAGRITFLNAVAGQLIGYTQAEAEGQPLESVFRIVNEETRKEVANPALRALNEGKIVGLANHTILIAKDGSEKPIDDSAAPIVAETGELHGAVLVFRDVTARRQTEQELRQLAAELSEADHRKDEFLATLAHELRNPMAPIRNGLQLMRLANGQTETIEKARAMMERQLGQLVRLVDDLMDVSRITRGRLELRKQNVALADVVNHAVESSRPLIDEMGHELTVRLPDQPIRVNADPARLAQVLMNLLTNAAKYTERGGQITLTAAKEGSDIVVSVMDTGIGISGDQLARIFEMFSQLDRSLEKSRGGLGIGLTLVKRLVEMHGGTIQAKSKGLGQGSEFIVRLPIVITQEPAPAVAVNGKATRMSLRILIVDDNHDGADSLALMLKAMGNEIHTAYDGRRGVELADQLKPDVVLLDIGLPRLNGYEACRLIRAEPDGDKIVMIAVTGWGQEDDMRRSRLAGFDYHLVKPVDPQALMKLLAGLRVHAANT